MTTDNSPALGGRSDDNAPMISSVLTRVIADARGAYLARNLDALIGLMDPAQKLQFNHTVVQLSFDYVLPVITDMPDSERNYPELLEAMNIVRQWLQQPDEALLQGLVSLFREDDFVLLYSYNETSAHSLLEGMCDPYGYGNASMQHALGGIICAQKCTYAQYNYAHDREIAARLDQWCLELAWSLIQNKKLPPPPLIDEDTLRDLFCDRPRMFAEENLAALIFSMEPDQRARYLYTIRIQGFKKAEFAVSQASHSGQDRKWLSTIEQWLDTLDTPSDSDISDLLAEIRSTHRKDPPHRVLLTLVRDFELTKLSDAEPVFRTCLAMEVAGEYAAHSDKLIARSSNSEELVKAARDKVRRWQLDAAWAILHDDPIPPMEPT
jgi:hypothetical protein